MLAFYVAGGGLGHLQRVRRFLDRQEYIGDIHLFTPSLYAKDLFPNAILCSEVFSLRKKEEINSFIGRYIQEHEITTFGIDTFPFGIQGELQHSLLSKDLECIFLARDLHWEKYQALKPIQPIHFSNTFLFEPVSKPYFQYILEYTKGEIFQFPEASLSMYPDIERSQLPSQDFWMVVHSGPSDEVLFLLLMAKRDANALNSKPIILVFTQCDVEEELLDSTFAIKILKHSPLSYYKHAKRIYSACGFNTCWETKPFRAKHRAFPFRRKWDMQDVRYKREWTIN